MAARSLSRQPLEARDTREQLIAATAKLMTDRNSVGFSLSEVAAESGVNAALVKYYFGNKRGLLLAIVEQIATKALKQLNELLDMNLSPESKLRLHIAGVIKAYVRHPFYNRLIHSLQDQSGPEVAKLFIRPLIEAQTRLLNEGYEAGVFRKVDPVFFYISVIGACDSLFYAGNTVREAFGIDSITDDLRKRYTEHVAGMVASSLVTPQASPR